MKDVIDALKRARELGMSESDLRVLCAQCGVEYGAILPPISGSFVINLSHAGIG